MHVLVIVLLIIGIFDVLKASIRVRLEDGIRWVHFSLVAGGVCIGAAVIQLAA